MRSKRLELMDQISAYIDQYYCERQTTPSVNEVALGVGVSKATAYRYLVAMDERGMLEYDGSSRTIVTKLISKFSTGSFSAPVVGAIPCGEPETEEENIVEYVSLPVSLFGHGDFYILKADGDSMTDAGIDNGDMVVIRKQSSANVGDIVVALDEHQLNTLKLYAGVDEETGEVTTQSKEKSETTVYVTPTGSKYHKEGCGYLTPLTQRSMTLSEAKDAGYTACSRCW